MPQSLACSLPGSDPPTFATERAPRCRPAKWATPSSRSWRNRPPKASPTRRTRRLRSHHRSVRGARPCISAPSSITNDLFGKENRLSLPLSVGKAGSLGDVGTLLNGAVTQSVSPDSPTLRLSSNSPLRMDSGAVLAPLTVAYQTYGALNAAKSNAILLCHALTGDQHVANPHPVTGRPGWWETMV